MKVIPMPKRMTKYEAAKELGVLVFDGALPQDWLNAASGNDDTKYRTILGGTVWSYEAGLMGYPRPITKSAMEALNFVDNDFYKDMIVFDI